MSTDISALKAIDGFLGAGLVDSETGLMLATAGGSPSFDPEAAGAANSEVVRARSRAMKVLGLMQDQIEDILITLGSQYHLIRPLRADPALFLYVALERSANLGLARINVRQTEAGLSI